MPAWRQSRGSTCRFSPARSDGVRSCAMPAIGGVAEIAVEVQRLQGAALSGSLGEEAFTRQPSMSLITWATVPSSARSELSGR